MQVVLQIFKENQLSCDTSWTMLMMHLGDESLAHCD